MKYYTLFLSIAFFATLSCSSNDDSITTGNVSDTSNNEIVGNNGNNNQNNNNSSQDWLIPFSQVVDGGPGKDGIPSIDNPIFINVNEVDYLSDNDLIVGILKGNDIKAYPHIILDWHEIVNDVIDNSATAINYCPLTGTAFGWKGFVRNSDTTFGVSGLLYNTNLILYDRNTDSNWSQLKLECVNGQQIGDKPETISVVETNWGIWKDMFPSTKVLSLDTGFNRNYGVYPYGDYITNHDFLLFNVSPLNNLLPKKERVFAVIDQTQSKVYRFTDFAEGKVIKDSFNGKNYLIAGNQNVINAFKLTGEFLDLEFNYSFNNSEGFFIDSENNIWNIFGHAIDGARTGQILSPSKSVTSYWFAIAAFYYNPIIYTD